MHSYNKCPTPSVPTLHFFTQAFGQNIRPSGKTTGLRANQPSLIMLIKKKKRKKKFF